MTQTTEETVVDEASGKKESGAEENVAERQAIIHSSLEGKEFIYVGDEVTLTAELIGFDDVQVTLQWMYSDDGGKTFKPIEGANEQTYTYRVDKKNFYYIWQLVVSPTDE